MPCTSVDPHITQHSAFRKLHKTLENFIEQWKTLLIRETPKTETYQQMHRYWTEWNCFRHEVKHHWTPQKASERHGSVENNEQYWTLLTLPRKCKKKNCITFELYVRFLKVDKLCVRQFSRRRWSVFKWTTKVRYDLELCVHGDQCLILHFVSIAYEKMWCAVGVPVDKSRFVSACSSCSFLHFCFASTKSLNWSLIACSLKFNKKFPDFSFWFFLATETTWEWFSDSIASYLVRSVPQPTQNLTKKTYGVCHYRAIFPKSYCKHHFWISGLSSRCHVLCGAWSDAQMVDVWHHGYDFFLMTWPGINKLSHLALFNNRFFSVSCMHLQHVQLITLAFPDNKATSAVYSEKVSRSSWNFVLPMLEINSFAFCWWCSNCWINLVTVVIRFESSFWTVEWGIPGILESMLQQRVSSSFFALRVSSICVQRVSSYYALCLLWWWAGVLDSELERSWRPWCIFCVSTTQGNFWGWCILRNTSPSLLQVCDFLNKCVRSYFGDLFKMLIG